MSAAIVAAGWAVARWSIRSDFGRLLVGTGVAAGLVAVIAASAVAFRLAEDNRQQWQQYKQDKERRRRNWTRPPPDPPPIEAAQPPEATSPGVSP